MKQHQYPSTATIKLLYARAVRCAYPNCSEPLYREDHISGTWVLNSRICHICARSEGGPRWDGQQSAEENRADANLVLMCVAHASAIDDTNSILAYPKELLLNWKTAQVDEHERLCAGWQLTGAMATAALEASKWDTSITLRHSNVTLISEGGRLPGAGGAGGPAFGPFSRAGDGGKGGDFTNLEGKPMASSGLRDFPISRDGAQSPGAGGGGAPAYGEGAFAGDGGGGGNLKAGTLEVNEGDVLEVVIGEVGKAARLPGQHGEAGGDTTVVLKSADGSIKRIIRVEGGAEGNSGKLPDDWVTISEADLLSGFHVSPPIPVNAAQISGDLLFALGAGWSKYAVPVLPVDMIWQVIVIAAWSKDLKPATTRGLNLRLSDPAGAEVSRIALSLVPDNEMQRSRFWCANIGASFDQSGLWRLSIHSGALLLSEFSVSVELTM